MTTTRRSRRWAGSIAAAVLVGIASAADTAAAVDAVVLPLTVPRGALVEINVGSCAMPGTITADAGLSPAGGQVVAEAGAPVDSAGAVRFVLRLPIDAEPGPWSAQVSCLDANGAVTDGPVTAAFTVATFSLLAIEPASGPAGTTVTIAGGGCPTGITDAVFARSAGASDDPIPLFDQATAGVRLALSGDGSFSGRLTVPSDAPLGEHQVWVYCVSEGGSAVGGPIAGVFVVDDSLPVTGSPSGTLLLVGTGALAAGLVLVRTARRPPPTTR